MVDLHSNRVTVTDSRDNPFPKRGRILIGRGGTSLFQMQDKRLCTLR